MNYPKNKIKYLLQRTIVTIKIKIMNAFFIYIIHFFIFIFKYIIINIVAKSLIINIV